MDTDGMQHLHCLEISDAPEKMIVCCGNEPPEEMCAHHLPMTLG